MLVTIQQFADHMEQFLKGFVCRSSTLEKVELLIHLSLSFKIIFLEKGAAPLRRGRVNLLLAVDKINF
ncbi:MAG: hypothetical protein D8M54_11480 [Chloroflexi bacterium]|nr:hypothetical protein [Chloroflexota bacterium]